MRGVMGTTGLFAAMAVFAAAAASVAWADERAVGDDCTNPIIVTIPADLPFLDSGQTTDLREDDYNLTCLGVYDDAQDIIYRLDVLEPTAIQITFFTANPMRGGVALDEDCPPGSGNSDCIISATNLVTGSFASGLLALTPGTYTVMIDSREDYWYIASFDFGIVALPRGAGCTWPLDVTSFPYSTTNSTCDKRNFVAGPCNAVSSGKETVLRWVVDEPRCVDVVVTGLTDVPTRTTVTLHDTCPITGSCLGAGSGLTNRVTVLDDQQVTPGTYYLVVEDTGVCTDFKIDILPCDSGESCCVGFGECITVSASRCAEIGGTYLGQGPGCASTSCPQAAGNSCANPLVIDLSQGPWIGAGTTCTRGADLAPPCTAHRAGEDLVYEFVLTEAKRVFVQRTSASGPMGVAVSSACPPDDDCIDAGDYVTYVGMNLAAGTHRVLVDAPELPDCVDFSLSVDALDPPPGDFCEIAIPVPSLPFEYIVDANQPVRYLRDYPSDCNTVSGLTFDAAWVFTPTSGMYVAVESCHDEFSRGLSVHAEDCQSAAIACHDSLCSSWLKSRIDFVYLSGGVTHYILVHSDAYWSQFLVTITERADVGACCVPDGRCVVMSLDDCASYGGVHHGSHTRCDQVVCPPPTGETCDDPRVIVLDTLPYVEINSTCGRTDDFMALTDEYCIHQLWTLLFDMFYRIDVQQDMLVTIEVDPLSLWAYPMLALNTQCPPYSRCIGVGFSNEHPLRNLYLDAGTYYLTIENLDSYSPLCGEFRLRAEPGEPSGACCSSPGSCVRTTPAQCALWGSSYFGDGTDCYSPPCPRTPGDTCENAIILSTLPADEDGSSMYWFFDDYQPSCQTAHELHQDVVYSYTATRTGRIEIDACGHPSDSAIIVFEDTCSGPEYACAPDECVESADDRGRMRCLPVTQGHTYYIVVDPGSPGNPFPNGGPYRVRMWDRTLAFTAPCPSDIVRTADAPTCTARVSFASPQYAGGCGSVSRQTRLDGLVINTPTERDLGLGVHDVQITVADTGGQLLECEYTITVVDDVSPTLIACVPNYAMKAGLGGVVLTPDFTPYIIASDNCPLVITQSIPADTPVPPGDHEIVFDVEDASGHTTGCSMIFTVLGPTCRGDANCDGDVNFFDIDPFVAALQGEMDYYAVWGNCHWLNGDCDQDGDVDFFDIDPFVERLASSCP